MTGTIASGVAVISSTLPEGVAVRPLPSFPDSRGVLTEAFRDEWEVGMHPVQWNVVSSRALVLRGVHVHHRHTDYLLLLQGRATIGLRDVRRGSSSEGTVCLLSCHADRPAAVVIPTGVAHGFLFHEPSVHLYSVSHTWDPADELGCRWDDPELAIPWPCAPEHLSERDLTAPTFRDLLSQLEPLQPLSSELAPTGL